MFEVLVREVDITPHPDPLVERLEVGRVDGFTFVTGKGNFKTGDLAVYIPDKAIVPDSILEEMGMVGMLSGSGKNRVKPMRLRGVLSEGLCYRPAKWPEHWVEGFDVGDELGIEKYEVPIPTSLAGNVKQLPTIRAASNFFHSYTDIENVKKFPNEFKDGETVYITEKLHGTCLVLGIFDGERVISSKGLAQKGLVLEENEFNTYWKAAIQFGLFDKLEQVLKIKGVTSGMLFGEVLGVQDLMYGLSKGQLNFRAFDMKIAGKGWLDYADFLAACKDTEIPVVPVLHIGAYYKEILDACTDGFFVGGKSTMADNIREGAVIRPEHERISEVVGGRLVLKSISEAYLTRKNGSEYN